LQLINPFLIHYLPLLELVDKLLRSFKPFQDLLSVLLNLSYSDIQLSLLLHDAVHLVDGFVSQLLIVLHRHHHLVDLLIAVISLAPGLDSLLLLILH
jgi:hypothetical protein